MWGSPVVLGGLGALGGNKLGYIRPRPSEKNFYVCRVGILRGVCLGKVLRSCYAIKDTGTPNSLPLQDASLLRQGVGHLRLQHLDEVIAHFLQGR